MADRTTIQSPGVKTTGGGTAILEQWNGWTPFQITAASPDQNAYSAVEVVLDDSVDGVTGIPYFTPLVGGRTADAVYNPMRTYVPVVKFEVGDLVMAMPSRSRPGDWEAYPLPKKNRITLPFLVYCDANEELQVMYGCLEGDFKFTYLPCQDTSSSSSGS